MSETPPPEYFSKGRIEAFSDGVFAIIVTLLVLELKPPLLSAARHADAGALAGGLLALLPKFLSWVVSFFIICVTWENHHRVLGMFQRIDHGVFWLNANLLLWLSFIPFPTALIGDFFRNPAALCFFGLALGVATASFSLLRFYGLHHPALLQPEVSLQEYRRGSWRSVWFGLVPYLAGAALAWAWPPGALLIYGLVPVYFITRDATRLA